MRGARRTVVDAAAALRLRAAATPARASADTMADACRPSDAESRAKCIDVVMVQIGASEGAFWGP